MKYGVCIGIEYYDLVAANGYGTITLAAREVAAMDGPAFEHALVKVKEGPLAIHGLNAFSPPEVRLTGDTYTRQALEDYAAPLLERAARLGAQAIGVGAPASRNLPEGYPQDKAMAQFKDALNALCGLAKPYGIDILLEAVCTLECNFITTTAEALAVVRRLGLPNLHLVYDTFHALMMDEPLSAIGEAGGEIRTVHVAGHGGQGRRMYLDEASANAYRPYFDALRAAGYDGEISMEAFYGVPAEELPKSLALLKTM